MRHLLKLIVSFVLIFKTYALANPCVIGELSGQLGNQMFQIATAFSLAIDNKARPIFPDLPIKENEGVPENYKHIFRHLNVGPLPNHVNEYFEPSYGYTPIPYAPNIRLHGYFQSWKYFDHHRSLIKKLFAPSPAIKKYLKSKYADILSDPKTVSIHIRTYFKEDPNRYVYPFNGREYVQEAMKLFPEDSHYIVFASPSDMPWCKENLADLASSIRFIEDYYIYDIYLQSCCRHNIISNSTFSWWSAYLNRNPKKMVVVPGRWFQPGTGLSIEDLIPPKWKILYSY
jgi:hypothetical protein